MNDWDPIWAGIIAQTDTWAHVKKGFGPARLFWHLLTILLEAFPFNAMLILDAC